VKYTKYNKDYFHSFKPDEVKFDFDTTAELLGHPDVVRWTKTANFKRFSINYEYFTSKASNLSLLLAENIDGTYEIVATLSLDGNSLDLPEWKTKQVLKPLKRPDHWYKDRK